MRDIARMPDGDRRELFRRTAAAMRVHEAIVEKDFWVCRLLDYLFHESPWGAHLSFKGGTSLSKAFGAIERFSEDIDLIIDWRELGYGEREPLDARTNTRQTHFIEEANGRAVAFLRETMAPVMAEHLPKLCGGAPISVRAEGHDVLIGYPRAFSLAAIQPEVRLEIGPLAAWVPHEEQPIRPYAAERFPQFFKRPETLVRTINAERTFWEKATILHQEAHRDAAKPLPPRYSRHYYDLYRLSRMPVRAVALAKPALLADVVAFKEKFYRNPWARYDLAKPGSLRLLPAAAHADALRRDYSAMTPMLFGEIPPFAEVMAGLAELEAEINALKD